MSGSLKLCIIVLIVVLGSIVRIETVTVKPLCPTNKVAPHKRVPRYGNNNARTFAAYYDLLTPGNINGPPSSLQEEPQSDDPDDCGEIEDYDENDLSSITPQSLRREGQASNRYILGWLQTLYGHIKTTTTKEPPSSITPPYKPTRPPTGGYFGHNFYRPPHSQEPTNHVKPVHEAGDQHNIFYRPDIVGGPNSQIIGLPQVMIKPIIDPSGNRNRNIKHSPAHMSVTHPYTHAYTHSQTQKPNRARRLNNNGILSSFLDLLY